MQIVALATLFIVAHLATAIAADEKALELSRFESKRGGYTLLIPDDWTVQEESEAGSYIAYFSQATDARDTPVFSLEIRRLTNWREALGLNSGRAKEATREYAERLRKDMGLREDDSERTIVLNAGKQYYGIDLYYSVIMAFSRSPDCTHANLLAGTSRTNWFHAVWRIPCSEFERVHPAVKRMRGSLRVDYRWN